MPTPFSVVKALFEQVGGHPAMAGVTVLKNATDAQLLEAAGDDLVIIRDGDPGEGEATLGGFRQKFYSHMIDAELYVRAPSDEERDQALDALYAKVVTALEFDITLGGLVQAMDYDEPAPQVEPIEGADNIKSALLGILVDYQSGPAA